MRLIAGCRIIQQQEHVSTVAELAGEILFGVIVGVSTALLFGWLFKVPEAGIPFMGTGWPMPKDPTWAVFAKLAYWGAAATLCVFLPKVYYTILVYQIWKISQQFSNILGDSLDEKGFLKGIPTAIWRSVPLFLEPLFFNELKSRYMGWLKRKKAEMSAERDAPELEKPEPKRKGKTKKEENVKKYEGKNIPLPMKGADRYKLKPGKYYVVDYVLEEHDAFEVGLHWDFRWKHPTLGIVDAVALPKHKFPELGKPVLAAKSDAGHGHKHMKNIPFKATGYGAGHTKTLQEGKAIIWTDPESRNLHILTDKGDGFAFVKGNKSGKDDWLMVRLSDSPKGGKPAIHRERTTLYKDVSRNADKIKIYALKGMYGERKYDGAMYRLSKDKQGTIWLISRRPAHKDNAPIKIGNDFQGIDKAYWVPALMTLDDKKFPRETEIEVEVLSVGKGKYTSSHARTAAILNMGPASALEEQQKDGFLIVKLLRVYKYDGDDWSKANPLEERKLREKLGKQSKRALHVPKARFTPKGIEDLYQHEVETGGEGIVLKSMTDPEAPVLKAKVSQTWDFRINSIHPVKDKRSSNVRSHKEANANRNPGSKWLPEGKPLGAGYITYITESGDVGKAGSGLTDDQRKELWEHPEIYLGEGNVEYRDGAYYAIDPNKVPYQAEIKGMSQSPSTGVIRAPVVERLRNDR